MVNNIPKRIMKKVYHILTSGNADIAFYTEAFAAGNKEWIMKKPITFGINLIKINIDCRIPYRKYMIQGLAPGKKCIARIHRRPKVYQYAMALMRFSCIITDVFGSLLELALDKDLIYKKIEDEYNLPGFQKLRKKKENNYRTITSIYEELSKEFNVTITKDIEINMIKRHLFINPYLKKAFEIAAYNQIPIVCILETSYSAKDIKDILRASSIELSDIYVSSERSCSFYGMSKEFVKKFISSNKDEKNEGIAVVSGNYNSAIKHAKGNQITPIYYRSAREIMKSIPLPNLTNEFKEVYQTIAGIELFSGQYSHKNLYECTYLYLAPAIYALLAKTHQHAIKSEAKIIALCDEECIFSILYKKYFGELTTCIWSGIAGSLPATKDELDKVIEDCTYIEAYQADQIAHALGFSFRQQPLKNCKEEFIQDAMMKARNKDKEAIKSYLNNHLGNENNIIVVDPMPGFSSLNCFLEYTHEINPFIEVEEISMSRFLKRDAKELSIIHQMLQMDTPYVMGFYGNKQLQEITFTQPRFIDITKKKIIYGAIEDFCKTFKVYQNKNNLKICPSDINKILEYSEGGLIQLVDELGGGII